MCGSPASMSDLSPGLGLILPSVSLYPAAIRTMGFIEPLNELKFLMGGGVGKAFPEARLMSSLVVALKTSQRLDGRVYTPHTDAEAAALAIDWKSWQQAFADGETGPVLLARGGELEITENVVFDMTSTQLDQYMDWYERTWAEDGRRAGEDAFMLSFGTAADTFAVPQGILDLFPLQEQAARQHNDTDGDITESTQHTATAALGKVLQSASIQQPVPRSKTKDPSRPSKDNTSTIRPGNLYRRFRNVEELDETTTAFLGRASKIIGVRVATLLVALFQMELKLERCQKGRSKGRTSVGEEQPEGGHDSEAD